MGDRYKEYPKQRTPIAVFNLVRKVLFNQPALIANIPSLQSWPKDTFERRLLALGDAIMLRLGSFSTTFVTFHLPNIRYLCNFSGSNAVALVSFDGDRKVRFTLLTDSRYLEQAESELSDLIKSHSVQTEILDQKNTKISTLVAKNIGSATVLGAEFRNISHQVFLELEKATSNRADMRDLSGLVESLRIVKEPHEIQLIAVAANIADIAFSRSVALIDQGLTELEFSAKISAEMMSIGAAGPSFETIVASGPNSSRPHARPSSRTIDLGDLVVIDFGAEFQGYRSDCTRSVFAGNEPRSKDMARAYASVRKAQEAGIKAIVAGNQVSNVDLATRSALPADLAPLFTHGTGHGVGLDIHEAPWVSSRSVELLLPNMVITVEPGVYKPNNYGIRIEDTLVVTANGALSLTELPK